MVLEAITLSTSKYGALPVARNAVNLAVELELVLAVEMELVLAVELELALAVEWDVELELSLHQIREAAFVL